MLFVCLGNICRSPLAEGALRKAAEDAGLDIEIDSARDRPLACRQAARSAGAGHRAAPWRRHFRPARRQSRPCDYTRFTALFAADHDNLREIKARAPIGATAEIALILDAVPGRKGLRLPIPITAAKSISRTPGKMYRWRRER